MKKTAIVLMTLALAACAHIPLVGRHDVSREDVATSVFQIRSDIEVDPSPVCEGDEACLAKIEATHHFKFMGTAWASGASAHKTQLMTAGHMCETGKTYEYKRVKIIVSDKGFDFVEQTYQLPILGVKYSLRAADGTTVENVKPVLDDDDIDACLMTVAGQVADPLPVADSDPEYGERCYFVGAPHGIWGGGLALITEATFSGRVTIEDLPEMLAFSGANGGGASGSPVICSGRVVGMLDRGSRVYPFFLAARHEDIQSVISRGNHRD